MQSDDFDRAHDDAHQLCLNCNLTCFLARTDTDEAENETWTLVQASVQSFAELSDGAMTSRNESSRADRDWAHTHFY
jgi:hypothetical protein